MKEEAYIRNKTGEGINAYCANRSAREVSKRILLRKALWLASGHTVMLRTTYSESLVFHACSETNYPDQCSVVVFSPFRQTLGSRLPKMA